MADPQRPEAARPTPRRTFPRHIRLAAVVVDTQGGEHPVTLTLPVSGYGRPSDGKVHGTVCFGDEEATFQYEEEP